jgi:hypothetical protein
MGLITRGERAGRGHPIPVHLTDAGRALLAGAAAAVRKVNTPRSIGLTTENNGRSTSCCERSWAPCCPDSFTRGQR